MSCMWFSNRKLPITLIVIQIIFIILFRLSVDYDISASPTSGDSTHTNCSKYGIDTRNNVHDYYAMFQDVHVMIFVGFGFLMVFLSRYGFSSVGLNMLLAAVAVQWSMLVGGFIHHGVTITISVVNLITADFASAAVLITFGALLGKTSPMQMVVVTIVEIFLFSVNEYIGVVHLQVSDIGGSMFIHAFGAYFGLAVAWFLHNSDLKKPSSKEESVYHSDLFAMCGTVFLWLFWPSFNSALAVDDAQHRAVLNTYLALAACCVAAFATSSLVNKNGKFDMVHIQNATLAGGVAVGTTADMMIMPFGALLIGTFAGIISVLGYKCVTPCMRSKLKIHDTCGVHNLHGMPALLAGVAGSIAALFADESTYGHTLYRQFPAMAPNDSNPFWSDSADCFGELNPGKGRLAREQAGFQFAALVVTITIAIVGGGVVGLVLKHSTFLGQISGDRLFDDSANWNIPVEPNRAEFPLLDGDQTDRHDEVV